MSSAYSPLNGENITAPEFATLGLYRPVILAVKLCPAGEKTATPTRPSSTVQNR